MNTDGLNTGKAVSLGELFERLCAIEAIGRDIRRMTVTISKRVTFIYRQFEGDPSSRRGEIRIEGVKLSQWNAVKKGLSAEPEIDLRTLCRSVVREVHGGNGYRNADSLYRFCYRHIEEIRFLGKRRRI